MTVFLAFVILVGLTVANRVDRKKLRSKSRADWLLDSLGLWMQGLVIPALQIALVYPLYHFLLPQQQGIWHLSPLLAFCLSFVGVDYVYYWNHRGLHQGWFWQCHQVHHTVTEMDVLGTSRNTLWTSFLIVYLWLNALFLYLLDDPTAYLVGVSLTAALDLWRHSSLQWPRGSWLDRLLSAWLILPRDHAWHHASDSSGCNFGGNLKLWDQLHGTYCDRDQPPATLGIQTSLTLTQRLLFPFS